MIELHEMWSAKINHVLKSPVWEYEVDNIMTTKYQLSKFPNWEFEFLSALNKHELAKDFKKIENEIEDVEGEMAQQNLLLAKPTECSPKSHLLEADVCKPQDLDMDLVENVGVKQPKARDKKSNSTASARTEGSSNGSLELEEDNYIPEIGSPEYALQMKEEVVERKSNHSSDDVKSIKSITSDPMVKSFSKNDDYQLFLETYKNEDEPKPIGSGEAEEVFLTHCDEDVEEDLLTPITPVVDKIQKLGLCDAEGYQLTYFSDDDEEEEDYRIERSDSFDRFCRKNSCESSSSSNEGNIPRLNRSVGIPA